MSQPLSAKAFRSKRCFFNFGVRVKGKKLNVKCGSSRFSDIGNKGKMHAARGDFQYSLCMAEGCRRCSYKRGTVKAQKAIIQGKNRGGWGLEVA